MRKSISVKSFGLFGVCALIVSAFFACTNSGQEKNYSKFIPPKHSLEQGIVNKYYVHFRSDDKMDVYTNIIYIKDQLVGDNTIISETYGADCKISRKHKIRFEGNDFYTDESTTFTTNGDTIKVKVLEPLFTSFSSPKGRTHLAVEEELYSYEQKFTQVGIEDTLIDERPVKVIIEDRIGTQHIVEGDKRDTFYTKSEKYYAEGIGIIDHFRRGEDYAIHTELIEQISVEDFEKIAKDVPQRVGYIDSDARMDKNDSFQICGKIYDYYNGNPDGAIVGGKKALKEHVGEHLNSSLLKGQDGLLTFRFVINCDGQVGYFTTEECDHNYQKKTFSQDLKNHLLHILLKVKKWQPCVIRENPVDSYAYITFKIKNGEIYEILP